MTKIEGKTSKEYLESLKAYIDEPGDLANFSRSAQKPEYAVKRNESMTDKQVEAIQRELASSLARFGNGLAADDLIEAYSGHEAFHAQVRTMRQCGVLLDTPYVVLVCIKNAVHLFPPQTCFYPEDALELIKRYVF